MPPQMREPDTLPMTLYASHNSTSTSMIAMTTASVFPAGSSNGILSSYEIPAPVDPALYPSPAVGPRFTNDLLPTALDEHRIGGELPFDTSCWAPRLQNKPAKPQSGSYWCSYCGDNDVRFKKASDMWKHVENYHETAKLWKCRHKHCKRRFCHEKNFDTHHDKEHKECQDSCYSERRVPIKVVACGMEGCEKVFCGAGPYGKPGHAVYDGRRHIAEHMKDGRGPDKWSYSTLIRNLFRQPRIAGEWGRFVNAQGFDGPDEPRSIWKQHNPDLIKYQLETQTFGDFSDLVHHVLASVQMLPPETDETAQPFDVAGNIDVPRYTGGYEPNAIPYNDETPSGAFDAEGWPVEAFP